MKKVLLIIPAYNEEECILNTVNKIKSYNKKNKTKYDALVINDGSTDKTGEILDKNKILHIDLIQNLGIGGAVQTGYKYAYENGYDFAVQFDGDGQHDVSYVSKLIEKLEKTSADMVIGSRFIDKSSSSFKSSFARRIGIRLISTVIKLKTKKRIYDTTSGFRAVNRNILELFKNDYPLEYPEPISTVDVILSGYVVEEVATSMNERSGGVSSIKSWKKAYYMINVILSILAMKGRKKHGK